MMSCLYQIVDAPAPNQTRKGFESMWILGSDNGSCYESSFKCNSDGSLDVYRNSSCKGIPDHYPLAGLASPKNLTWVYKDFANQTDGRVIGYFSMDTITLNPTNANLSASYSWITNFPPRRMSVANKEPLELFGTICQFLLIFMAFGTATFYLGRTLTIERMTYKLLFVIHLIWVGFGIHDVYRSYWAVPSFDYAYANPAAYCAITTIGNYFLAFATLGTYLVNADLVLRIVWGSTYQSDSSLIYTGLVAVHLGLYGYIYLTFPACLDRIANSSSLFYKAINDWNRNVGGIWYIYFILFDAISSFAITYYIVQQSLKARKDSVLNILKWTLRDLPVAFTVISQVAIVIIFAIIYFIPRYTLLPGSDRNVLAYENIRSFVIHIHAVISCFSFDYLAVTLLKTTSIRKKMKARVSTLGNKQKGETSGRPTSPVGLSGPVMSPSPISQEDGSDMNNMAGRKTGTGPSVVRGVVMSNTSESPSRNPQQSPHQSPPRYEIEPPLPLDTVRLGDVHQDTVRLGDLDTRKE